MDVLCFVVGKRKLNIMNERENCYVPNQFFKNILRSFYSGVGFNIAIAFIESSKTEPSSPCIFKSQVLSQSCCHLTPPLHHPFSLPVITPFPSVQGGVRRRGLLVPCWQMGWYLKTLWTAWLISLVGEGRKGENFVSNLFEVLRFELLLYFILFI